MMTHTSLNRAEQVARHWHKAGCPVVIHVDRMVPKKVYNNFVKSLETLENIRFSRRLRCEWGTWGLVEATQDAAETMLSHFPNVRHVYLASGACLPLRPVQELIDYLAARPTSDFIESVTTSDVPWTVGGLDRERFTLRFPFSWRRHRKLFDAYVGLQRKLRFRRKIPNGIVPHMGSQWWCLTRATLNGILRDPNRETHDQYFKRVWIPDESYFQTLARLHSKNIESRSLTLSKFDFQGKPHTFHDDHLQLLRRSDCFVARKIWPEANLLYDTFLNDTTSRAGQKEPNPGKIDRIFSRAVDRRTRGRPGLYMQSRFPNAGWENGKTSGKYSVFCGFSDVFVNFENWLAKATGARVHGHLFAPERVQYAFGDTVMNGAISDSATTRNYNPKAFLTNLIWNTRGERQCFQFGPADNQKIAWFMATDPNAQISIITGAWAIPLLKSKLPFKDVRKEAAQLQRIENKFLGIMRSTHATARIRIWSMSEFIETPVEPLQTIMEEIGPDTFARMTELPRLTDLTGFGQFLQDLKNEGMHPYLVGDYPVERERANRADKPRKPYLVK